jgi:ribosomal protein L37AE/L43A
MRDASVLVVARGLRVDVQAPRERMHALMTCPACGHRLSAVIGGARQWRCYACRESGDALSLASYRLFGAPVRSLVPSDSELLREFCLLLLKRESAGEPIVMHRRARVRTEKVA